MSSKYKILLALAVGVSSKIPEGNPDWDFGKAPCITWDDYFKLWVSNHDAGGTTGSFDLEFMPLDRREEFNFLAKITLAKSDYHYYCY